MDDIIFFDEEDSGSELRSKINHAVGQMDFHELKKIWNTINGMRSNSFSGDDLDDWDEWDYMC